MNYLIITNSTESSDFANLLIQEIRRFDIRATVFHNSGKLIHEFIDEESTFETTRKGSISSKAFTGIAIDLAIFIGDSLDKAIVNHAKKNGAKTCFLQLSTGFDKGNIAFQMAAKSVDKIFTDLPIYASKNNADQVGHYLTDAIRKHDFTESATDQLSIGLLVRNKKNLNKLANFAKQYSKSRICYWNFYSDLSEETTEPIVQSLKANRYSNRLDALKHSNAVIVDSDVDAIAAALMNCPQVSIIGSYGLFRYALEKKPLLNLVAGHDLVKNCNPAAIQEIQVELNQLLNDHEYCASMLTSYQQVKEKIGTQPVARSIAQKLVEWIEDD